MGRLGRVAMWQSHQVPTNQERLVYVQYIAQYLIFAFHKFLSSHKIVLGVCISVQHS